MKLRFEVSPSEAGKVVDGLHAQSFDASLENQQLGQESYVVAVEVDETDADEVRDAMQVLATRWTESPTNHS